MEAAWRYGVDFAGAQDEPRTRPGPRQDFDRRSGAARDREAGIQFRKGYVTAVRCGDPIATQTEAQADPI